MAGSAITGKVDRVVTDKGFGFIHGEDGVSYFFHRSEVRPPLSFSATLEGARVSFVPDRAYSRGPRANEVTSA